MTNKLCIFYNNNYYKEKANEYSIMLNAPVITNLIDENKQDLILKIDNNGLTLIQNNLALHQDFNDKIKRLNKNNLSQELLIKACKIKGENNLNVIDMTAGLGEDSILLAAYGYNVTLFENNKLIYLLLDDALRRGENVKTLNEIISKMKLIEGNSIELIDTLDFKPDIIYLDPMFPKRTKSSLIKKKFQLLHELELPCENEEELLKKALEQKPKKVVIKRPLKENYLANIKPSYSLKGSTIRFDCFINI